MFHLNNVIHTPPAILAAVIFSLSYLLVILEEFTLFKKSKPVLFSAGAIWAIVAYIGQQHGLSHEVEIAVENTILQFSELFLFLLVAISYVNTMEERQVFHVLSAWLIRQGMSYRKLFWMTGFLAFFLSPFLDNLTTALIMGAVIITVGKNSPTFVGVSCINIVVAANAGGAFTPFGDVTTLMVWQHGTVNFFQFMNIFFPALVSYLIPAFFMVWAVPKTTPHIETDSVKMLPGAKRTMLLFILTIITAVAFHQLLGLPAMLGMTTGLAYLTFLGHFLKRKECEANIPNPFDIFSKIAKVEWDTLLFFYGIMLSISGLGVLGYLSIVADGLYMNPANLSLANTLVGILSAILGNIPVLFALLTMNPEMSTGQWLLITLTTGIGGNLLSIGSAAGIALMGQAKGKYTFFKHFKWIWAIALGYFAAVFLHMWINKGLF
jgi:Na+/H+ antiporter NhaD/arsenite permease-like protein